MFFSLQLSGDECSSGDERPLTGDFIRSPPSTNPSNLHGIIPQNPSNIHGIPTPHGVLAQNGHSMHGVPNQNGPSIHGMPNPNVTGMHAIQNPNFAPSVHANYFPGKGITNQPIIGSFPDKVNHNYPSSFSSKLLDNHEFIPGQFHRVQSSINRLELIDVHSQYYKAQSQLPVFTMNPNFGNQSVNNNNPTNQYNTSEPTNLSTICSNNEKKLEEDPDIKHRLGDKQERAKKTDDHLDIKAPANNANSTLLEHKNPSLGKCSIEPIQFKAANQSANASNPSSPILNVSSPEHLPTTTEKVPS